MPLPGGATASAANAAAQTAASWETAASWGRDVVSGSARQPIADAPHGLDRVAEIAELLAQAQDGVVDGPVALDGRLAPCGVVEVCPAERAALLAQQPAQ